MSNKEEIKTSEVEEKKLTDEELDNVSGGAGAVITKLKVSSTQVKQPSNPGSTPVTK